ncbi:hypothetical protein HB763_17680 [Vibrio campbellii]|uniref:hypothetical protein n=1 Tax=Vibrio campbellii TaxID=680 RepID=UPI00210899BD|nr:hypothetical protein [Vibrio campbellii]UTZ38474.1 hypothetical protein HB763_17680 [Vibrio campbellii]
MLKNTLLLSSFISLGATASPIQIDSCEQLLNLEDNTNSYYVLLQNIDCSGFIHTEPKSFAGNFDGNGYAISNLTISAAKGDVGLFSIINAGEIKNLTISNFQINTQDKKAKTVGALAGLQKGGLIKNVTITDSEISNAVGSWAVGLLVGRADSAMLQDIVVQHSALSSSTDSNNIGGVSGWLREGAGANKIKVREGAGAYNIKVNDVKITVKNSGLNSVGGIFGNVEQTKLELLEIADSSLKRNDLGKSGRNGLLVGQLDKSTITNGSVVNVVHNLVLGKYNGIAAGTILQSADDEVLLDSISHNDVDNSLQWHYVNPKETYRTNNLYLNLSNESTLPPSVCRF